MEGNKNAYASVINDLHPPIITRYVRLIPVTKLSTTVCMRVELYGCPWEGRTHEHTVTLQMSVCPLALLTLEVVDSVDLDFNLFSEMFTSPQRRVNSLETFSFKNVNIKTCRDCTTIFNLLCNKTKTQQHILCQNLLEILSHSLSTEEFASNKQTFYLNWVI